MTPGEAIPSDESAEARMRLEAWLLTALRQDYLPIEFLAALDAAGWALVPTKLRGYELNEAGFFLLSAARLKELERCEAMMLAARPR